MKTHIKYLLTLAAILATTSCLKEKSLNIPYEGFVPANLDDNWTISNPDAEYMDGNVIDQVYRDLFNEDKYPTIRSLLIIRNGKLVGEAYCKDINERDQLHNIMSVTKSITSILAGISIDHGIMESVESKVYDYIPQFFDQDVTKREITLHHVLTMETGLNFDNDVHTRELLNNTGSSLEYVLQKNLVFSPGTNWYYGDGNPQLISGIINQVTGKTESDFAAENLFSPLGITRYHWESTPDGLTIGSIGLWLTPRDMAKIGLLMANKGWWNGVQLVSEEWVDISTKVRTSKQNYGYYWYPIGDEAFYAEGNGGQIIYIYPEKSLVVVITSDSYSKSWNLSQPYTDLFNGIISSLKD